MPIRVLLADDHTLVREGIRLCLEALGDIAVVGEAADGRAAVELALELEPDVVLMDIAMPVLDGIEATRRITDANPDIRVLMLTGSNTRADVARARRAGVAGYVTKDRIAAELIDAILEVASR